MPCREQCSSLALALKLSYEGSFPTGSGRLQQWKVQPMLAKVSPTSHTPRILKLGLFFSQGSIYSHDTGAAFVVGFVFCGFVVVVVVALFCFGGGFFLRNLKRGHFLSRHLGGNR